MDFNGIFITYDFFLIFHVIGFLFLSYCKKLNQRFFNPDLKYTICVIRIL